MTESTWFKTLYEISPENRHVQLDHVVSIEAYRGHRGRSMSGGQGRKCKIVDGRPKFKKGEFYCGWYSAKVKVNLSNGDRINIFCVSNDQANRIKKRLVEGLDREKAAWERSLHFVG